jgi:CDGSH iron-sulfur domain-containing protein 3
VVDNTEVVIKVRDNGPYKVTGPVTVVDAVGNRFELGDEPIALCRCGRSERKPFCDASHRATGFAACDRA